jgi:hypothetical protein
MMPGMPIIYGLTDLTDLRITMVKNEGFPDSPETSTTSHITTSSRATGSPMDRQGFVAVYKESPKFANSDHLDKKG